LNDLLAGDPSDVIQSLNTLGMFTIVGDNVPIQPRRRPVFPEPSAPCFFYAGLLLSVWRWRQPRPCLDADLVRH
jgi:hypothetical protein